MFENPRKSLIQHCELRSYVYILILNRQKFMKNAKKIISRVFENWSLRSNSVTRQVTLKGQKLVKNAQIFGFSEVFRLSEKTFDRTKIGENAKNYSLSFEVADFRGWFWPGYRSRTGGTCSTGWFFVSFVLPHHIWQPQLKGITFL